MTLCAALVDFLGKLIWPAALLWLAHDYKAEIIGLLPRVRKAGVSGIELDAVREQSQATTMVVVDNQPGKLKEFPGMMRTPAIERVERDLHTALEGSNVEPKLDFVLRLLAQSQLEAFFERTYRTIFGSQILGLRRANELGTVTVDQAKQFFAEYEKHFPEFYRTYGFDGWLNYLVVSSLVEKAGDKISVTELGRDFLQYMFAKKLPDIKPY